MSNIKLKKQRSGCIYCTSHKMHTRGDGRQSYYKIERNHKQYFISNLGRYFENRKDRKNRKNEMGFKRT